MRRTRGHTLVELMVVTVILGVLFTITMRTSPAVNGDTLLLRDRALAGGELAMAVETILADLGGARRAELVAGQLHITREPAVAAQQGADSDGDDDGIRYSLDESGDLVRQDLELSTVIVVAQGITAFDVSEYPDVSTGDEDDDDLGDFGPPGDFIDPWKGGKPGKSGDVGKKRSKPEKPRSGPADPKGGGKSPVQSLDPPIDGGAGGGVDVDLDDGVTGPSRRTLVRLAAGSGSAERAVQLVWWWKWS